MGIRLGIGMLFAMHSPFISLSVTFFQSKIFVIDLNLLFQICIWPSYETFSLPDNETLHLSIAVHELDVLISPSF